MAPFEELQSLWQSQAERPLAGLDVRGLSEQLRRFGKHQTWINLLKAALLVFTLFRLLMVNRWAPVALCGAALMYAGLIVYLVLDWRNQIGISRLDFSVPSVEFVRQAGARLRQQLNPMRRLFWPLVLSVGGGFNLLLLAEPAGTLAARVARHLTATATPFAAYVLGLKIREFRFRRECGAVLEHLERLVRAMEEPS